MDPCLDDCIEMAKKLKRLGVPIGLDVLPGLPHGFLSFVKVKSLNFYPNENSIKKTKYSLFYFQQLSKEAYEGNRVCMSRLAELLGTTVDPKC